MSRPGNTLPDDLHLRHELGEVQMVIDGETRVFRPEEALETLIATRETYISALVEAQKQPSLQSLAVVKEAKRLAISGLEPVRQAKLFREAGDTTITTSAFTDVFSGAQQLSAAAEILNPNWEAVFSTKEDPDKILEDLLVDSERAGSIADHLCLIYLHMANGAENALFNSPAVEGFFADSLKPVQSPSPQESSEISKNRKLIWSFMGAAAWNRVKTTGRRKK